MDYWYVKNVKKIMINNKKKLNIDVRIVKKKLVKINNYYKWMIVILKYVKNVINNNKKYKIIKLSVQFVINLNLNMNIITMNRKYVIHAFKIKIHNYAKFVEYGLFLIMQNIQFAKVVRIINCIAKLVITK